MEEELDTKFFEIKEKYSQQNECDTICLQERKIPLFSQQSGCGAGAG